MSELIWHRYGKGEGSLHVTTGFEIRRGKGRYYLKDRRGNLAGPDSKGVLIMVGTLKQCKEEAQHYENIDDAKRYQPNYFGEEPDPLRPTEVEAMSGITGFED